MTTRKTTPKDFGDGLQESANKIWLAGLGAVSLAEQEGGKLFDRLVKKGERYEEEGRERIEPVRDRVESYTAGARKQAAKAADELVDRAGEAWTAVGGNLDEAVAAALAKLGVPSRDEIRRLTRRIEHLTELVEKKAARPAKRAPRKSAKRRQAS
jgi:poly(hydroxyalkanoate) granule-associated protein